VKASGFVHAEVSEPRTICWAHSCATVPPTTGSGDIPGLGRAQILYSDNDGNPAAHDQDYHAWRTEFRSGGFSTRQRAFRKARATTGSG
jgi:hypothetical protein